MSPSNVTDHQRKAGDSSDAVFVRQAPNYGIKRMLFVASMYFWMSGINNPTHKELAEVNKRFSLAHGDRTLLFPAAISKMVWGKVDLSGILEQYKADGNRFSQLSNQVVAAAPGWVKYGEPAEIARDIKAVFDSVTA